MKLQILGSAAGGRVPNPFCRCPVCEQARTLGGKNIRKQAQLLIDGKLLIDFGMDAYANSVACGYDLTQLETLLFTHEHWDHCTPEPLSMSSQNCGNPNPLYVFGNAACERKMADVVGRCQYARIKPYETVRSGGYTVTALPADHNADEPLCYIISDGEKTVLYSTDTGYFADEVYDFIQKGGYRFDAVLSDATLCFIAQTSGKGHMSLAENEEHRRRLGETCTDKTRWVLTHHSHGGLNLDGKPVSAEELEQIAAEKNMLAAYDGMELEV